MPLAKRTRSKEKVVHLDQRVQVSRAVDDIPEVGLQEVRIFRKPGVLSFDMEALTGEPPPEVIPSVIPMKKRSPKL